MFYIYIYIINIVLFYSGTSNDFLFQHDISHIKDKSVTAQNFLLYARNNAKKGALIKTCTTQSTKTSTPIKQTKANIQALRRRVIEVGFHSQAKYKDLAATFAGSFEKEDCIRGLWSIILREIERRTTKYKCASPYLINLVFASLKHNLHLMKDVLSPEELERSIENLMEFHHIQQIEDNAFVAARRALTVSRFMNVYKNERTMK